MSCPNCGSSKRYRKGECDGCGYVHPADTLVSQELAIRFCSRCACTYGLLVAGVGNKPIVKCDHPEAAGEPVKAVG